MLYEVITRLSGQYKSDYTVLMAGSLISMIPIIIIYIVAQSNVKEGLSLGGIVITSYSIHYTKLYDVIIASVANVGTDSGTIIFLKIIKLFAPSIFAE